MRYCSQTAKAVSQALHIPEESVLVASTGVIGMQLPMDRIAAGFMRWRQAWLRALQPGRQPPRRL